MRIARRNSKRKRNALRHCAIAAAATCPIWNIATTRALTINLNAPATMSAQAVSAFRVAADRWQANFTDNVTVNIDINFLTLAPNVLGSTSTQRVNFSFATVRNGMTSDISSADDTLAVASLPSTSTLPRLINFTSNNPNGAASLVPYLQSPGGATISMAKANARAIGLSTNAASDAAISFSNQYAFDFDPSDGINGGEIDFVGVAAHEIGHALGFSSTVDTLDINGGTLSDASTSLHASTMDLFRYSTQSQETGPGVIDFTADSRNKYFSIDRGVTPLASFSKGRIHGDGNQASHWIEGQGLGLMGPSITTGVASEITELDRRMFDVLGWNRNFTWKWIGASNNTYNWNDPQRWNTNGSPDTRVDAVFNTPGANVSALVSSVGVARTLLVSNSTLSIDLSNHVMRIGNGSSTAVTLDAGGVLSVGNGTFSTILGTAAPGSTGANLQLNGNSQLILQSGTLLVGGALVIGASGAGAATVSLNAGAMNLGAAFGTDQNLYVGQSASARVNHGLTTRVHVPGNVLLAATAPVSTSRYEMAGGTLTINGSLAIAGTINAPTAGAATFAARGNGSVTISGTTQVYSNGTLILDDTARLTTGALNLAGGRAVLTSNGGKVLRARSLAIAPTSSIDLANNTLILDYTSPDSPYNAVLSLVQTGYHNGAWDGLGIRGSSAANDSHFALGIAEAGTLALLNFADEPIDSTTLLVDFTYSGDSNLDGRVDIRDLYALATNWQSSSANWITGDFNYNGTVDVTDLTLLAANWQAGVGNPLATPVESLFASLGLPEVAVPEPATTVMFLAGLLTLRTARRPRRGI